MGNWMKVLQNSMSRHNMSNPDKPKLVTTEQVSAMNLEQFKILYS